MDLITNEIIREALCCNSVSPAGMEGVSHADMCETIAPRGKGRTGERLQGRRQPDTVKKQQGAPCG